MSSFQGGISSAYHSISPYRLYLDLSSDDKDFMTNIKNPLYTPQDQEYEELIDKTSRQTVLDILHTDKRMTQFKMFIETYRLQHHLKGNITLFVPIDDNIQILKNTLEYTVLDPQDMLDYHILDYILTPVEILDRKLRLQTKLRNQYFLTDGPSIINEFTAKNSNKIIGTIKAVNGYIYLIEKPLVPYIY